MRAVSKQGMNLKEWTWMAGMSAVVAIGTPAYGEDPVQYLKDVAISGNIDAGYQMNLNQPKDTAGDEQPSFGRVFDKNADSFVLHLAELSLVKAPESGGGFGLVLNYGADVDTIDVTDSKFVQQGYVYYGTGGGSNLKLGKLATLAGAEVIEGALNYNISRSILFGYAINFTNTGLRYTYAGVKGLTLVGGINNGWNVGGGNADDNYGKTIEAQVGYSLGDLGALVVNGMYGPEASAVGHDNRSLIDVVATIKPMGGLTFVLNFDSGSQTNGVAAGQDATWSGYAVYANYAFTDATSATIRAESLDDGDNFLFSTGQPITPSQGITMSELTLTVSHKVGGVDWRAEYRYDKADEDVFLNDEGALKSSQSTIALAGYYAF
jgi:hypothetical protein